jgi:thiol-disulfide isomerase/thioredoxin
LEIEESPALSAAIVNGTERVPVEVGRDGDQVTFAFPWYDAEITANLTADGQGLDGVWRRTSAGAESRLAFAARRGGGRRFGADGAATGKDAPALTGSWETVFTDDDGESPAVAELEQQGDRVTGTFLTPTGDYRFLAGNLDGRRLRLSTFDGSHAFLFDARLGDDGTLAGDFWSRDSYHASWVAHRAAEEAAETTLPDAWTQVRLTNDEGRLSFAFPDLAGGMVTLADARFAGKVVLVNLFGSWCPNCNDEAPLLAEWQRRYRDQGLEIVGLAYEFTGRPERDRRQVERYAERWGIDYPLLLAGVSDKSEAAATLPDLERIVAYPTTIFVGRDGRVRRIHSGFSGPGTGAHFQRLVAELQAEVEALLAEG